MKLVLLKLCETLARALFVFICIYFHSKEQSGQFGILVTLMGLFAFAFGYERHVDIQRRHAASPPELFDTVVAKTFSLYGLNYAVLIPLFLICAVLWSQITVTLALACVVIVVSEHISNKTYLLSLVTRRFRNFLVLTVIKNSINFLVVAYWVFLTDFGQMNTLVLADVIMLWACTSAVCSSIIIALWLRINQAAKQPDSPSVWHNIKQQFKWSFWHFSIGLFAILSLQLDRIMAGSLLPLDQVGLYFRHVTLVAFIYQFFNIASFNRLLPSIYANAHKESISSLRGRTRREYFKVLIFAIAIYASFLLAYISPLEQFYQRFELQVELLGILLVTFLIRAAADFNGLVYNAKHKEKYLLKYQMIAVAVGLCAFTGLTHWQGMVGTVIATLFAASTYFILTRLNFKHIDAQLKAAQD